MKKFNKKVVPGTQIKLVGIDELVKVKTIHETRKLITVDGYMGSFQVGHVERFTNEV